jgi:hypothetical protein
MAAQPGLRYLPTQSDACAFRFWPARPFQAAISILARVTASGTADVTAQEEKEKTPMDLLWTVAVILVILWLLGLVTSFTLGGFVHILLVLAIIVILIRVIQGRRPV